MKLKVIFLSSFVIVSSALQAQWQWTGGPKVSEVNNLFAKDIYLFAATDSGVFRTSDNGKNWIKADTGLNNFGIAVKDFTSMERYIFAAGETVYRSSNNGKSWTKMDSTNSPYGAQSITSIGSLLYTAGYGALSEVSSDSGITWNFLSGLPNPNRVFLIRSFGSILFASGEGGVSRSIDSGSTWNFLNVHLPAPAGGGGMASSFAGSGVSIFFSGDSGVYRSTDNGANWIKVNNGLPSISIYSLTSYGSDFFALSDSGVFISTNNGSSWEEINEGLGATRFSLNVLYADDLYVYTGTIYKVGPSAGVWRRPLSDFGISDVKNPPPPDQNISLSPNPTTWLITVHNAPANMVHVTITNVLGLTVSEVTNSGAADFTIDLSKLLPGTYFAKFSSEGEVITRR